LKHAAFDKRNGSVKTRRGFWLAWSKSICVSCCTSRFRSLHPLVIPGCFLYHAGCVAQHIQRACLCIVALLEDLVVQCFVQRRYKWPPEHIIIQLLYHAGRVLGQLIHELLYGLCAFHDRIEQVRRVVVCQGVQESLLQPLYHCLQAPVSDLAIETWHISMEPLLGLTCQTGAHVADLKVGPSR
jgi:hypothetical protein